MRFTPRLRQPIASAQLSAARRRGPAQPGKSRFIPMLLALERLELANSFGDPLGTAALASLFGPDALAGQSPQTPAPAWDGSAASLALLPDALATPQDSPASSDPTDTSNAAAPVAQPPADPRQTDSLFATLDPANASLPDPLEAMNDALAAALAGNPMDTTPSAAAGINAAAPDPAVANTGLGGGASAGSAAPASTIAPATTPLAAPPSPTDQGQFLSQPTSATPADLPAQPPASSTPPLPPPSNCSGASDIATVSVDYGANDPHFLFHNHTDSPFTNVTLSGLGYSGNLVGLSGMRSFADIQPNTTLSYYFYDPSGVFRYDLDDFGYRGNIAYTFSAEWQGQPITAVFSPDNNATGHFLPFLGNDHNGQEDDQPLPDTVVATIGTPRPVPDKQAVTVAHDTSATITLTASNPNGDPLTYTIFQQPSNGQVSLDGDVATYTPNPGYSGGDQFLFQAHDGAVDSNLGVVTIHVDDPITIPDEPPPNSPPTAAILFSQEDVYAGQPATLHGSATDPDGQSDITSIQWDFNYDGTNFVPDPDAAGNLDPSHTFPDTGIYLVALQVTDSPTPASTLSPSRSPTRSAMSPPTSPPSRPWERTNPWPRRYPGNPTPTRRATAPRTHRRPTTSTRFSPPAAATSTSATRSSSPSPAAPISPPTGALTTLASTSTPRPAASASPTPLSAPAPTSSPPTSPTTRATKPSSPPLSPPPMSPPWSSCPRPTSSPTRATPPRSTPRKSSTWPARWTPARCSGTSPTTARPSTPTIPPMATSCPAIHTTPAITWPPPSSPTTAATATSASATSPSPPCRPMSAPAPT